jgi:oligoribonuclease
MKKNDLLVWIDLEMTGLDPDRDRILEIATLVTDKALNVVAEGPVLAIQHSEALLSSMDPWCIKTHGASGLAGRVLSSRIDVAQAEQLTLAFLKEHLEARASPMCGNSICQDRRFLFRHMKELEAFFHYRNLDVSTVKELARRWKPEVFEKVLKRDTHLALEDIKDSIAELKIYREWFFRVD